MEIAVLKDWVVFIYGLLGIVAILIFIALVIIIYRKVTPILNATKETVNNVRDTSSFVAEHVIRPVAKMQAFISGLRKGLEFIAEFRGKEGKKDGEE